MTTGVTAERRLAATMAAAGTGFQVGAAMVASRFVVDQTGPASLAMLRYVIGFLCLLPVVLATARHVRFARADVAPMALLGIVQFGALIALLNVGLRTVPAGRAAVIFALFPLLTMLLGAALGRERFTPMKTAGVLLTILGVACAVGEKALASGAGGHWWGELAILGSAFCGALCSVLYRPYLKRYPAVPVSAFAMFASVGFLALLAAGEGFFTHQPTITGAGWLAILFIGVSSGIGYFLWLFALGNTSPTRVTMFLSISPFTATMLGALFLGEAVTTGAAIGLVGVILGLVLAYRDAS